MAANITLATGACDTTGKVWTFPLLTAGAPGSGYAITNATGLTPHIGTSGNSAYGLPIASVAISTTNLVVTLSAPVGTLNGTLETLRFDLTTAATITDGSGNTPTGQTNVTVTNNSTVAVTGYNVLTDQDKFELNGLVTSDLGPFGLSGTRFVNGLAWSGVDNWPIEFVADATDIATISYSGAPPSHRIDTATATTTPANGTANFSIYSLTPTPLASAKHLVRMSADYFVGVRVAGGARTMHAVPTTKRTVAANTTGAVNVPSTTPIQLWGTYAAASADGYVQSGHTGVIFECQTGGTGLELATVTGTDTQIAVSVDAASEGALLLCGDSSTNGINDYAVLCAGLTPATTHTIRAHWISDTSNTTHHGVRATNGTRTSAAGSIGDGSLSVADVTYIAVNDWVRVDDYGNREWRQVTAITGTGPYTLTLNATLAKAHASGVQVTSYSAPAATITAWQKADLSAKRVVGMGDSNTQGAWRGTGVTPNVTSGGVQYAWYDNRQSYGYKATQLLNYEFVNVGIQGTTTTNQLARKAEINTYSRSAFDYLLIREGTNDINTTGPTKATCKSDVQGQIDVALPNLRAGGRVVLVPVLTPAGTTNAGGLNLATFNAALSEIAADPTYSASTVYAAGLANGFNLTDWNATTNPTGDLLGNLHFSDSGIIKSANNTIPYISATGFTTSGTSGTITVTRAGGSTFANANGTADAITLTASTGTITATAAGGTITNNGTGAVTVKPVDGATSFTYTATATATITYTNAQNWTDPAATSYSAAVGSVPATPTLDYDPTHTSLRLTGSSFSDPDVGDTHAATQWQLDAGFGSDFSSPDFDSGDDTVHLTTLTISGLTPNTIYTVRARYKDSAGNYSAWSANYAMQTATAPGPSAQSIISGGFARIFP